MKIFNKETATQLERMERVWALEDCKKLINKFCFHIVNASLDKALDELWVKTDEYRSTASYGRNWGFFYGFDEVKRCLLEVMKAPEKGYMSFTNYSTSAINIAGDGQSAYGVFAAVPVEVFEQDGGLVAWKSSEKICCNFVLEDDEWKIWKLFVGTEMSVRVGDDFTTYPCDLEPDAVPLPQEPICDTATIKCDAFTYRLNSWDFPPLPRVHDSYDASLSCGPEGHPDAKEAI